MRYPPSGTGHCCWVVENPCGKSCVVPVENLQNPCSTRMWLWKTPVENPGENFGAENVLVVVGKVVMMMLV